MLFKENGLANTLSWQNEPYYNFSIYSYRTLRFKNVNIVWHNTGTPLIQCKEEVNRLRSFCYIKKETKV